MKDYLVSVPLTILLFSCSQPTQTEKDLRATINKEVSLEIFDLVRQGNTFLTLEELRQQYDHLSVVYLQNGDLLTISNTPKQQRRSEEHTSELQSRPQLVCRLLH